MKIIPSILVFIFISNVAFARPLFLNLDSSTSELHPEKYGFDITSSIDQNETIITVSMNKAATNAFRDAKPLIIGDLKKEEIPKIQISEGKESKVIKIICLTKALSNYMLRIESLPIRGTEPLQNFAGYNVPLSIRSNTAEQDAAANP